MLMEEITLKLEVYELFQYLETLGEQSFSLDSCSLVSFIVFLTRLKY